MHLLPHLALPVIQREITFYKQSQQGRARRHGTASMGTPFRLQALARLEQQTLSGLRVFLVSTATL